VRTSYITTLNYLRWNLGILQNLHWVATGVVVNLVARLDEWWDANLQAILSVVQIWAIQLLDNAAKRWGTRIDIMQVVDALRLVANTLAIARTGFPTNPIPVNIMPPQPP
jgi:hypothetical protein